MTPEPEALCECGFEAKWHHLNVGYCFHSAAAINMWRFIKLRQSNIDIKAEAANSRCQSFRPAGVTANA